MYDVSVNEPDKKHFILLPPHIKTKTASPSNPIFFPTSEPKLQRTARQSANHTAIMTTYNGKCHCGQTEWTTKLDGEAHILWYVPILQPFSLPLSPHLQVLSSSWTPPQGANRDPSSHCDACKVLSGTENTLNQMANEGDLKITKGTTKTYTYYGDSGTSLPQLFSHLAQASLTDMVHKTFKHPSHRLIRFVFTPSRQASQLLLLPQLHRPYLPPPDRARSQDCRPHSTVAGQ